MQVTKIESKISSIEIIKSNGEAEASPESTPQLERVHENMKRPVVLSGKTYQLKTPPSRKSF